MTAPVSVAKDLEDL